MYKNTFIFPDKCAYPISEDYIKETGNKNHVYIMCSILIHSFNPQV